MQIASLPGNLGKDYDWKQRHTESNMFTQSL